MSKGNRLPYLFAKRGIDLAFSLAGLLVFAPILALIALSVSFFFGSPVFFRQQRPGLKGKPFYLYKFRTMLDIKGPEGMPLPDERRLTSFGKFLRKTSLDEVPELFNVLKGEMSLVGPRPLLMEYLDRYTPEQSRRHEAKPGITGWAQINGRNTLGWEDRFRLDVWYVDNQSLWLDFKIMALTFWKTLRAEGINQPGKATMEKFGGSQE
jgi:sugar transferase EpsL